jgi:hypothetical protein
MCASVHIRASGRNLQRSSRAAPGLIPTHRNPPDCRFNFGVPHYPLDHFSFSPAPFAFALLPRKRDLLSSPAHRLDCRMAPRLSASRTASETIMCDIYIYYFMSNEVNGENGVSVRPAILEAIKGRGRPLMESQIVVDDTELDRDGFLAGGAESHGIVDIDAQIWSLGVGAASRDRSYRQYRRHSEKHAGSRKPRTARAGSTPEESALRTCGE